MNSPRGIHALPAAPLYVQHRSRASAAHRRSPGLCRSIKTGSANTRDAVSKSMPAFFFGLTGPDPHPIQTASRYTSRITPAAAGGHRLQRWPLTVGVLVRQRCRRHFTKARRPHANNSVEAVHLNGLPTNRPRGLVPASAMPFVPVAGQWGGQCAFKYSSSGSSWRAQQRR